MVCFPRKVRIVGGCFTGALVLMVIIGWLALPLHLRQQFTPFQLITLLAVLIVIVTVIGAIAMSSVRASAGGLILRNGFRTHRVDWAQVGRIVFREGDPWAVLVIDEDGGDETATDTIDGHHRLVMLGIQRSDGRRADAAVAMLRKLHASHAPTADG